MKNIFLLIALLPAFFTNAQTWEALSVGTNDDATSLAVYKGNLYVGGVFTTAGVVNASGIATWNGSTWAAVGGGISAGEISTLLAYDSMLYAGGNFTAVGGKPTNNIAQWDGTNWTVWGEGATSVFGISAVNAMVIYNGELIIGGQFDTVDGVIASGIAEWNGIKWTPLGSGVMADAYYSWAQVGVYSLAVYNGQLYVGGSFDSVQGLKVSNIASWDGTNWHDVGTGIQPFQPPNPTISALCTWNGNLYAGGDFDTAGGIPAQELAEWNGNSWSAFGNGANSVVNVLFPYQSKLYAGGYFTSVGSSFANSIAQWDGTDWSALSTGMTANLSPAVYAIAVYNSSLYACGQFTDAGGNPVNNIAKWTGALGINEINSTINFSIYPNPNNGVFTIQSSVVSGQWSVEIYNVLGERVYTPTLPPPGGGGASVSYKSTISYNMNLSSEPNGVYLFKVLNKSNELIGDGKVILQK